MGDHGAVVGNVQSDGIDGLVEWDGVFLLAESSERALGKFELGWGESCVSWGRGW